MKTHLPVLCLLCVCVMGCSSVSETEPSGSIARYGTIPTIDGVFEEGEWDDAEIVRAGKVEQFRIKHDGNNLYFAVIGGGGEFWFDTDQGLRILHWSAQLGSVEYIKSDSLMQSLDKPFAFGLWGLQHESPSVIEETLTGYLTDNGWAANIAPMGDLYQSELVVSLDWLGVNVESGRFVEIPGVRISAGLLLTRGDPRNEVLMSLALDERKDLYPPLLWPAEPMVNDSLSKGIHPETIRVDHKGFGKIWIDLEKTH